MPFPIDLAKSVGKRPNQWEMANFDPHNLTDFYAISGEVNLISDGVER